MNDWLCIGLWSARALLCICLLRAVSSNAVGRLGSERGVRCWSWSAHVSGLAWPGLGQQAWPRSRLCLAASPPFHQRSPGQPPDLHHHHPLPGPASGVSLVAASTRLAVDLFLQLPERGTVPSYSCMLSSLLCVLKR